MQTAKALENKQTNVYELQETLTYFDRDNNLPKRGNANSIYDLVEWLIEL